MTRECKKCKVVKPRERFTKDKRCRFGITWTCLECYYATVDPFKARVHQRRTRLRQRYGMTEQEYDDMLESQNWACAICDSDLRRYTKRPPIDHCHETGRVRGILCHKCNGALGWLGKHQIRIDAYTAEPWHVEPIGIR